jgi:peptide/nickel transport system permease protein
MMRYLGGRIVQMVPVVFLISVIVFFLTMLLPGDPTVSIVGEFASPAQREIARVQYGFDQPVPVQYARWIARIARGDLGRSLRTREHIVDMLKSRLPVTIEVAILSIIVAIAFGIPLGIIAALHKNSWIDALVSGVSLSSLAVPNFWAGILLIYLFSLWLGLLPPSGFVPFSQDPLTNLKLMIMPALTLGTSLAALIMRQSRASILEVLSADFIRTAHAKGLTKSRVFVHHALRNSLIPLATVIGLQFGHLLGGAVIVETIFNLPGLGRMLVDGIFTRDAPAVQGAVIFIILAVLVVNLATDLVYALIDPRIDFRSQNQK